MIRREIEGVQGRGSILNRVAREDVSEKRFEPKLEGGRGVSQGYISGESVLGGGHSTCKSPGAEVC